jgi:hypothetical protein
MYKDRTEQAIRLLIDSGLATGRDIKGCATLEIEQIESTYQIRLPPAYVSFMTRMGRGAGKFLEGSDFLFPAPLSLRAEAEALLTESDAKFSLKKTDFVYLAHQGYQFLYFGTDPLDDPPIYLYVEQETPKQVYDHFSEWLLACVDDEIAAFKAIHG